jgi:hypothetical protein
MFAHVGEVLPQNQVVVAATYLKGSASEWLNGVAKLEAPNLDFVEWSKLYTLQTFLDKVEQRWRNPQQGREASDHLANLEKRSFSSVRSLTNYVEKWIVVPGVEYNLQVLLTTFLRCCPPAIRAQLAAEASTTYHDFPSFSQKALTLEAALGTAASSSGDGRKKKTSSEWKQKSRLMFVDTDGTMTEVDDASLTGEVTETGSDEAMGENLVAAAPQQAKSAGRGKGQQAGQSSKSKPKANATPAWVKMGIDKDIWMDRYKKHACTNCGNYGHPWDKCKAQKVLRKVTPVEDLQLSSQSGNSSGQ